MGKNTVSIQVDDLYLLSHDKKNYLSGSYTKNQIIDLMIDKWIPYFECHKCGRWDYCKFVQPHPANPERSIDIKCGVVKNVIANYINTTFDLFINLTLGQKQHYLNAMFYLAEYIIYSEQSIGTLMNEDYLKFFGTYSPSLFGMTRISMDLLNKAHIEMKHVPFFNSKKAILFVEGESEEIFCKHFTSAEIHN